MFENRHWNRIKFPNKHILVCEDFLNCQAAIASHFSEIFDSQGEIVISYVSGARSAAGLILHEPVHLIILDYDMPHGNGQDLMVWLRSKGYGIPIITFSGLEQNNDALMSLGATHRFNKAQVIAGEADSVIRQILEL